MKKFIVKMQVPLMSSDPEAQALVYNEDRDVEMFLEITPKIKKLMGTEHKKFFEIKMQGNRFEFVKEVPDQNW